MRPLGARDDSVAIGSEIYDASEVKLELYSEGKFVTAYAGLIDVQRPKPDKNCAPCDNIRLAPADNKLVRVN